jgi:hypothetical protein
MHFRADPMPKRRPLQPAWQRARAGSGFMPMNRTRSPKDGLPPVLK